MFELAWPGALLMLPLPLLVAWLLPPHRQPGVALRVPFFARVVAAAGARAQSGAMLRPAPPAQRFIAALAWALLVAALARPQWLGAPIVHREVARDVMLAVDLSASMAYRDFPAADGQLASRFAAVQRVVDRYVARRRDDRVGLIVFGDRPYLQLPFTRDIDSARGLVALMEVGMAGPRTALGDAIGLAIRAFESSTVDDRIVILLTDGSDTGSRMTPLNAAAIAAQRGLEIYTIGIGDTAATGEDRVDFAGLAQIAERSGGAFFQAEDETALESIYRRIDAATAVELRTRSWRPRSSLVHWPAMAALLVLLIGHGTCLWRAAEYRGAGR